jgi:hypothetical protein
MAEDRSPWAPPPAGSPSAAGRSGYPSTAAPQQPHPPEPPILVSGVHAGAVTRLTTPQVDDVIVNGPAEPPDLARRNRLMLRWFGGVAAAVVAVGLAVVLGMTMTGNAGAGLLSRHADPPPDTRPHLAKLCPPPSTDPRRESAEPPPAPPGPRTVDAESGISYRAYGAPWEPWDQIWNAGTLHVVYKIGQHIVTEPGPRGEGYHASILSGSVPAAANDALVLDLKCTGHQVAADVRAEYYFQPTTIEMIRDEQATLGGRPAWVTKFRLHFSQVGLTATDELVGVALIDVGRPEAAILYVSIPGTHRQFDHVVDEVLDSVRPA